jgi:hypothetical protein
MSQIGFQWCVIPSACSKLYTPGLAQCQGASPRPCYSPLSYNLHVCLCPSGPAGSLKHFDTAKKCLRGSELRYLLVPLFWTGTNFSQTLRTAKLSVLTCCRIQDDVERFHLLPSAYSLKCLFALCLGLRHVCALQAPSSSASTQRSSSC